ncbi:MAG: hypothetical protein SXA11_26140, partial [Cyanobacteriota bacterium]|nr:hypothetical protein [Cyanobacteriota bacterium]
MKSIFSVFMVVSLLFGGSLFSVLTKDELLSDRAIAATPEREDPPQPPLIRGEQEGKGNAPGVLGQQEDDPPQPPLIRGEQEGNPPQPPLIRGEEEGKGNGNAAGVLGQQEDDPP